MVTLLTVVYLIVHLIGWSIAKVLGMKRLPYAFCGMVGYYGDTKMDEDKFKIMMLYNDSRGGDGTGVVLNNHVTKSGRNALYFFHETSLDFSKTAKSIVLGHARKSSVGGYGMEKAHPVAVYKGGLLWEEILSNKDIPDVVKFSIEPELVLVMNGTVKNTNAICAKFDVVPTKTGSDTQDIALLLHKLGKEGFKQFFTEYEGACTMMWYWADEPQTLHVLKDTDRPLYIYQKNKKTWISSMDEAIKAAIPEAENKEILRFADDCYYRLEKGVIDECSKYEKKKAITVSSYFGNGVLDWDGSDWTNYKNKNKGNKGKKKDKDAFVGRYSFVWNKVTGRYMRNGHPIHGAFYVNDKGECEAYSKEGYQKYFFFHGLLVDEAGWTKLCQIYIKDSKIDMVEFMKTTSFELSKYSSAPVKSTLNSSMEYWSYMGKSAGGFIHLPLLPYQLFFKENALHDTSLVVEGNVEDSTALIEKVMKELKPKNYTSLETMLEKANPEIFKLSKPDETFEMFIEFMDSIWGIPSDALKDIRLIGRSEAYNAFSKEYDVIDAIIFLFSQPELLQEIGEMVNEAEIDPTFPEMASEFIVLNNKTLNSYQAICSLAVVMMIQGLIYFCELEEIVKAEKLKHKVDILSEIIKKIPSGESK